MAFIILTINDHTTFYFFVSNDRDDRNKLLNVFLQPSTGDHFAVLNNNTDCYVVSKSRNCHHVYQIYTKLFTGFFLLFIRSLFG